MSPQARLGCHKLLFTFQAWNIQGYHICLWNKSLILNNLSVWNRMCVNTQRHNGPVDNVSEQVTISSSKEGWLKELIPIWVVIATVFNETSRVSNQGLVPLLPCRPFELTWPKAWIIYIGLKGLNKTIFGTMSKASTHLNVAKKFNIISGALQGAPGHVRSPLQIKIVFTWSPKQ